MNSWSRTRKRIIFSLLLISLLVLIGLPIFFLFYRTPTCNDLKLNGDETGVDCGGSCELLCSPETLPLLLQGDPRVLTVAPSTYEVAAIVENPNPQAEVYRAGYTVRVYGNENAIPLKTIEGETHVSSGDTFAIFEGPFALETGVIPTRATLEWGSLTWEKNVEPGPEIVVKDEIISKTDSSPRLEAVVENLSLENVANLDLVAIISDAEGNIFAASKTFIDTLAPGEEAPLVFSWPRPFEKAPANIEIYPRILPDRSFLR